MPDNNKRPVSVENFIAYDARLQQQLSAMGSGGGGTSGGGNVPTGGTTDQVLTKLSNADFDVGWRAPATGSGGEASSSVDLENLVVTNSLTVGTRKPDSSIGAFSFTAGESCEASGRFSQAMGIRSYATIDYSHAEGASTASGVRSHAEGASTAENMDAHSEGYNTQAIGKRSHAGGYSSKALADVSFAHGYEVEASGENSVAFGRKTIADQAIMFAIGRSNKEGSDGDFFVVGNGALTSSYRSNIFRISLIDGILGTSAFKSTGADYAEYFEWYDGNRYNDDRRGRFVTINGERIALASPGDYIFGVVSGSPSMVGDAHEDQWNGMYERDIFGAPIFEDVEVPDEYGKNGNLIRKAHVERGRKLNPNFNSDEPYIPRSQRKEWAVIGLLGKLVMVDDGNVLPNDYVTAGQNGIAVYSPDPTRFRVLSRLDESHIKVLIL